MILYNKIASILFQLKNAITNIYKIILIKEILKY
jgi:hypothetical protein